MEITTKLTFTVNVRLEQVLEKELPQLMIYVFDATGQFLANEPLQKGKQSPVKMELPSELEGKTLRVVLGPSKAKEREEIPQWMDALIHREVQRDAPSITNLTRSGGYEKRFLLDAKDSVVEMVVYPHHLVKWILCPCVVRGRLVKPVPLADGTIKELGVCHACVKIYEVDKIPKVILQLAERDVFRLRDDLWKLCLVFTPVIPLPPPEPLSILKTRSLPQADQLAELEPIFRASSISQLRNALIAKAELLADYFCSLKWLWYKFHTDLIKCVCTDEQGRFETTIMYHCTGDKPDLYFKAVQCIGGTLHTLYDPGVVCHTHWNYICGSEVVLETDDRAAITCVPQDPVIPPVGVSVWIMPYGVGSIKLNNIKTSGLTDITDKNGNWIDIPFGGTLGFRLGYSSGIPNNVMPGRPAYYRWCYNKLDDSGVETDWRDFAAPVAGTVERHYIDYDLAHPELPPTFPPHQLGPKEKNNMYEFKPQQPPALPGHKREWPVDDWFGDIYSGIFDTVKLPGGVASAAGKYKIKLEIYDKDGNLITPGAGNFEFIVPTGLDADGLTILTRPAAPDEIEGGGFIFYLHIDNNHCEAEIYDASVGGVVAGPCGFISYGTEDDVHLSFKARHPNGFARFKFTVVRGSYGYILSACAPANNVALADAPLVSDTPVNGFNRNALSVFTKDVDEASMLDGCQKAAFGENLHVAATATDGWRRLSELDAYALPKAFALEPKTI